MSVELAGLASSFTALNTLTKTMIGLRDASQLNAKVVEFQHAMIEANSHVISVQQEYLSLTTRVHELEKENVRLKDWSAEKQRYTVREVAHGVFACLEKDFVGNLESAQKLCYNCFDQGIKSLLQQSREVITGRGISIVLTCPRCKSKTPFDCYKEGGQSGPMQVPIVLHACPYCQQPTGKLLEIKPDKTFGNMGLKIKHYKCTNEGCGRDYEIGPAA